MKNFNPVNKKQLIRQSDHFTTPPRMEGRAKNAKMSSVKKPKRSR